MGGEVRAVSQREQRLKEAAKLGFPRALVPPRREDGATPPTTRLELQEIGHLHDLVAFLGVEDCAARRGRRDMMIRHSPENAGSAQVIPMSPI